MNQLYPLKFKPIFKEKIWGGNRLKSILNKRFKDGKKIGESWEISGIEGNLSVVENGFLAGNDLQEIIEVYMGDLVGERIYEQFGLEFPLLIKFIDATEVLSVQVHPDDALAAKHHNTLGKTEMWYIIHSEKNSKIISGFNHEMDKHHYLHHLNNNELQGILNYHDTRPGDVFYIPSGRIHAIGGGVLLAEIQQSSDITYRIYDWDRKDEKGNSRELHNEFALDAIDFKKYDNYKINYKLNKNQSSKILSTRYFQANSIVLDKKTELNYNLLDSFVIFMCIEGEFEIEYYETERVNIKKGETVLVPAVIEQINLVPVVESKVLEIYIPDTTDEYSDSEK
ncbi:MAG: mannose-6-phosphate isomerase [Bacteroidetes bacterium GWC2_33_15]|nr:MAG: mannose-6-phosphate isomerase [Bacteroidetes bacterium GWA2_33_15]OFX51687.1 MAG: mannose-6-phosphate isomerase [Bacteroidetes bacterium GWC2_33_15]OFX66251.1 MAG: mannose-6-phosphate isomerase [Bacteroidetes bacterium GWB2_32_14]OFX66987.1 MAG: mannose-6-phosphate isomerase [Bacteroidetes bacterium GWD2_33_33]HAN17685.1 mannose-6-phosphate isomerase [Bacteroidales bacterium]